MKYVTFLMCIFWIYSHFFYLAMVYLWSTCGLPVVYLWSTCGLPVVYLWSTCGLPVVYVSV